MLRSRQLSALLRFYLYSLFQRVFYLCFTELGPDKLLDTNVKIRPINMQDFLNSLKRVRHSVSSSSLAAYEKWNREYGDVSR